MAAKAMYNYLSSVEPDYSTTTLDIKCKVELIETGGFSQEIHEADDTSEEIVTYSNTPIFIVELQWPYTSESDTGTIIDFFYDTAKGFGFSRSFKWEHPTDGHIYVVRFRSKMSRKLAYTLGGALYHINTIQLKVIGRFDVNVSATQESLTLTVQSADININVSVSATQESLTLSEQNATVKTDYNIQASQELLTLYEQGAAVTVP